MTSGEALRWMTLATFGALMALCVVIGWRRPRMRPLVVLAFIWAAHNAIFYAEVLFSVVGFSPAALNTWSSATKHHAVFAVAVALIVGAREGKR